MTYYPWSQASFSISTSPTAMHPAGIFGRELAAAATSSPTHRSALAIESFFETLAFATYHWYALLHSDMRELLVAVVSCQW